MAPTAALRVAGLLALAGSVRGAPAVTTTVYVPPSSPSTTPEPYAISHHNVTSHGPYTGPPATTTGALSTSVIAPSIAPGPPPPEIVAYPADGKLHAPQPMPYTPAGGIGTNGSVPVYKVASDFDYQSLALALYHEWIELDLFHWGLATFSDEEFDAYGIDAGDRFLLQHMADQEIGHASVIANMLGPNAPKQCTYNYPVSNVREYIDFNQKLTRWAEAGVYGFLPHLNSGPAANMLLQSITIEARQQLIFRQFGGQFPMPEWHTPGIPQSWAWTLLAPYISSCPYNQTRLNTLSTKDIPADQLCVNATDKTLDCPAAVSNNRSIPLSYPGRKVFLQWDPPGQLVGPNNSYVTTTNVQQPKFAAWLSQLNVTYTPLQNINATDRTAYTIQPNVSTWKNDPAVNGTMFIALTDTDLYVTPYNVSMINPHVAALAVYQAG